MLRQSKSYRLLLLALLLWAGLAAATGQVAAEMPPPERSAHLLWALLAPPPYAGDNDLQVALCQPDRAEALRPGQMRVPILLYHYVGRESLEADGVSTSRYNVTTADFAAQLELLDNLGYHTITVAELAAALSGEFTLPPRPIVITLDDGWIEQYDIVLPLLQARDMRATFFIPSTYLIGGRFVTAEQARELIAAGMEIGSHTRTHLQLTGLDEATVWQEIAHSKVELEARLGAPITSFSYPFGAADSATIGQVQAAGYTAAVGLGPSTVHGDYNRYYLGRIEVQSDMTLSARLDRLPWRGAETSLCRSALTVDLLRRFVIALPF
mgnify:CR=1 FL=1